MIGSVCENAEDFEGVEDGESRYELAVYGVVLNGDRPSGAALGSSKAADGNMIWSIRAGGREVRRRLWRLARDGRT